MTRIAHILRKYNPAQWGGTETAVYRLLDGLRPHGAEAVVYCPRLEGANGFAGRDPLAEAGHTIERFRACVPVWGISQDQRQQLIAVGGNLMSIDLLRRLRQAPGLSVIHTHAMNRLGGVAATAARLRRLPLVVTIHGGALDLPSEVKEKLAEPLRGGFEWGRIFGWLLGARRVLDRADAILTCNQREADLLRQRFPGKIIYAQPHGVVCQAYQVDHRSAALSAFPNLAGKKVLLAVGRIDPVKNQAWLVQQLPRALEHHPDLRLVLVGACTDEAYGKQLKKEIRNLGLESWVTLTGGLPAGGPTLIGLLQCADLVAVPSLSETFGLVILESWAAGTPVACTRTSGALDLVVDDQNGRFFDLNEPASFHAALDETLNAPAKARAMAGAGERRVREEFDSAQLARRIFHLYQDLAAHQRGRT